MGAFARVRRYLTLLPRELVGRYGTLSSTRIGPSTAPTRLVTVAQTRRHSSLPYNWSALLGK